MKIINFFPKLLVCIGLFLPFTTPFAQDFKNGASYSVCFTPGQDCEGEIVGAITSARQSILVQAYSFTSSPIAKALVEAKNRGVDVRVILDKSQFRSEKYSSSAFIGLS